MDANFIWSWVLAAVGLVGFILAGKKIWWAWYVNLGCQALWFTYAIVTVQYGFVVAAIVYSFVFYKNAIAWTREHKEKNDVQLQSVRSHSSPSRKTQG